MRHGVARWAVPGIAWQRMDGVSGSHAGIAARVGNSAVYAPTQRAFPETPGIRRTLLVCGAAGVRSVLLRCYRLGPFMPSDSMAACHSSFASMGSISSSTEAVARSAAALASSAGDAKSPAPSRSPSPSPSPGAAACPEHRAQLRRVPWQPTPSPILDGASPPRPAPRSAAALGRCFGASVDHRILLLLGHFQCTRHCGREQ